MGFRQVCTARKRPTFLVGNQPSLYWSSASIHPSYQTGVKAKSSLHSSRNTDRARGALHNNPLCPFIHSRARSPTFYLFFFSLFNFSTSCSRPLHDRIRRLFARICFVVDAAPFMNLNPGARIAPRSSQGARLAALGRLILNHYPHSSSSGGLRLLAADNYYHYNPAAATTTPTTSTRSQLLVHSR